MSLELQVDTLTASIQTSRVRSQTPSLPSDLTRIFQDNDNPLFEVWERAKYERGVLVMCNQIRVKVYQSVSIHAAVNARFK